MALKIRLRRMGRKKAPTYRLVIAESSMPRDGRFVANIGHYNPRTDPMTLVVDRDRARAWLEKGAMPTETVHSLLKRAGVYGEEPGIFGAAVAAVTETAQDAAGKVKGAATKAASKAAAVVKDAVEDVVEAAGDVVENVVEAAGDAVEEIRERVAGGDEAEAAASETEAAGGETEEGETKE